MYLFDTFFFNVAYRPLAPKHPATLPLLPSSPKQSWDEQGEFAQRAGALADERLGREISIAAT